MDETGSSIYACGLGDRLIAVNIKKDGPARRPLKGVGAKPPTLDPRMETIRGDDKNDYRCDTIKGISSSKVRPVPFSPIACIFHSPLWRYSLAMIWAVCEPCTDRS